MKQLLCFGFALALFGFGFCISQAAPPTKSSGETPEKEIFNAAQNHLSLIKSWKSGATRARMDPVTGSFSAPASCGMTYSSADVITKGIPVGTAAGVFVSSSAPEDSYTFFLMFKVWDETGKVLRDYTSTTLVKRPTTGSQSGDMGVIDVIKDCYCGAHELQIEIALVSISPTNKMKLLQHQKGSDCVIQIK